MDEFAYRFRKHQDLLGERQELERQQIYFASMHELNDPMEGYRKVVWRGDGIQWRNLLRNYVRTLLATMDVVAVVGLDLNLQGKEQTPTWVLARAQSTVADPAEQPVKRLMADAADAFLGRSIVQKLAVGLAARTRPLGRWELTFHLRLLHFVAARDVSQVFAANGLLSLLPDIPDLHLEAAQTNVDNLLGQPPMPLKLAEGVCELQETFNLQMEVIDAAAGRSHPPGYVLLARDFPRLYVESLMAMTYPEWHVACFVATPTNASSWSAYAGDQTGVCLKFRTGRTDDGRRSLVLNGGRSWTGSNKAVELRESRRFIPMVLSPVLYDTDYPEVPFFTSLGQLPIPVLNRDWFSEDGVLSPDAQLFAGDAAEWRKGYWERFYGCVNRKTPDWAHEQELRLDISSSMAPFDTKESRLLDYRFEDLQGIIFGVRTPVDAKTQIIKIIDAKCRAVGRAEFEFHQAAYSPGGAIEIRPLSMIKVGQSSQETPVRVD
jgi:hypothetical protein